MKKIFTLIAVFFAFTAFLMAQTSVVYCTKLRDDAVEGSWEEDNDVIIQMLQQDANINLTVKVLDSDGIDPDTGSPVDLSTYDVIILHDAHGSGDNFWKEGYPGYLGSLPAPTIYNKLYALRSGRALTTGTGASTDWTNVVNLTVVEPTSELFSGIDASSGTVTVAKGNVADNGDIGEKCLQYNTGNVLSASNTLLAYPEGTTDDVAISFSDIPAGSSIDEVTLSQRMITLGFNVGMPRTTFYDGLTAYTTEGLTIWRNAVYMLAGLEVPDSPASVNLGTSISTSEVENLAAYGVQGGIKVPADMNVSVYSISGELIAKEINDDFIATKPGIYIVKADKGVAKVAVIK